MVWQQENWLDSGCILKVELPESSNRLGSMRERRSFCLEHWLRRCRLWNEQILGRGMARSFVGYISTLRCLFSKHVMMSRKQLDVRVWQGLGWRYKTVITYGCYLKP